MRARLLTFEDGLRITEFSRDTTPPFQRLSVALFNGMLAVAVVDAWSAALSAKETNPDG